MMQAACRSHQVLLLLLLQQKEGQLSSCSRTS